MIKYFIDKWLLNLIGTNTKSYKCGRDFFLILSEEEKKALSLWGGYKKDNIEKLINTIKEKEPSIKEISFIFDTPNWENAYEDDIEENRNNFIRNLKNDFKDNKISINGLFADTILILNKEKFLQNSPFEDKDMDDNFFIKVNKERYHTIKKMENYKEVIEILLKKIGDFMNDKELLNEAYFKDYLTYGIYDNEKLVGVNLFKVEGDIVYQAMWYNSKEKLFHSTLYSLYEKVFEDSKKDKINLGMYFWKYIKEKEVNKDDKNLLKESKMLLKLPWITSYTTPWEITIRL